uniref:SMB domain-containing protein n=1 Tax=Caenorhabditis japonica TaxID=281687 RepID=A0A8R1DV43_CAEJA
MIAVDYGLIGQFSADLQHFIKVKVSRGIDDGIGHLPTVSTMLNEESQTLHQRRPDPQRNRVETQYYTPHYESSGDGYDFVFPDVFDDDSDEKIGKLVLPDIIEMDGSGADRVYEKYGLGSGEPESESIPLTTQAPRLKTLIFGQKRDQRTPVEEITRYSLLSKYMPLKVTSSPLLYDEYRVFPALSSSNSARETQNLYYLESSINECYCDEHCVTLGDCCSDYTFVCPPRDCVLSDWDRWTKCTPDNGTCGIGAQKRVRHVVQHAERGGARCEALKEMKTCFVDCQVKKSALDDITTVALILDYKYNKTRARTGRNNIYWDLPKVVEKVKKASYYCVHYSIEWVNRNCISSLLAKGLTEGSVMCAECQPSATYHRNNGRCASDLEDGDQGFWKLIGPKSCNGIWTRINRTDNCQCQVNYPLDYPFLLV